MTYKAIIFDLDGTLLDTLTDLADATNQALRSLGFPERARESYKTFVGDGVEILMQRVLPRDRQDSATIAECAALMQREYSQRWAATSRPYQGIPELLNVITARGIPMAVLSNKPDEFTRLCVETLLPDWKFAVVLGAVPSLPKKPDPAGALVVAEQMKVVAAEIVYVGDTNTDMQTATAAGMFPVGVLWGFRTAAELTSNGAKLLVEQPLELLRLIGQ